MVIADDASDFPLAVFALPHVDKFCFAYYSVVLRPGMQEAMDADLGKYLPLWKLAVPAEFENTHAWDFSKFGRGERFVYETIPHAEFDEVMDQVKRWGLDDYLKDRSFENLAANLTR